MPRVRADLPAVPLVRTDGAEPVLADRYELRSILGSGGMGTVWEAYDRRLGRSVALKILRDDLPPWAAARLEREARAAARIRDRRVVAVLDLDRTPDGAPYLVLECHDGHTLADELRDGGALGPERLDLLIDDLLGALGAAHECGVLHRDVKPANVLAGPDGFRVTDFGLASLDDDQTTETDLMGTLVYVAPERLDGARGSTRSDVFSAAVVLYEAACGVQPFRAEQAADSVARLRAGAAPPLPEHLPGALRATIQAALSPEPGQRPADAAAMLAAIRGGPEPDVGPDPTIRLDATAVLPSVDRTAPTSPDAPAPATAAIVTGPTVAGTSPSAPAPTRGASVFAPEPSSTPRSQPSRPHPALERSRQLLHRHGRRPEVIIGAFAAAVLVVLLLVVALDPGVSADPAQAEPAAEQGNDAPAEPPADLDEVLDRIEEIGR